ncbi:MAG: mechanosensitive ion channel [candidate division WS1 bacterium]|jgi:small conductance mechanosensitive channel|nr:mechanosensitive ion channel [candidate division WS1 bacterium]
MIRFYEYVRTIWLGALPQQLIRAILVAILFELLLVLVRRYIQARLKPVLLRDAGDPPAIRVARRRLLLAVPIFLSRAVLYVIAVLIILRIFGLQTWAEVVPIGLALVVVCLVAFWRVLRDVAQGYLILYDHLYTRGERVIIAGREGVVQEIGLRSTHLHTTEGANLIIPHSQVNEVVNLSRGKRAAAAEDTSS